MNLNKVMLIGNLTRDPETRTTPAGQTVTSFVVATNFSWTDQQGQRHDKAEFHNIVAWRKLGEICGQYLRKGSKIYIEGRLQTRSWDDTNTGTKKYWTEVIAENMIMLDRKQGADYPTNTTNQPNAPKTPAPSNPQTTPEPTEEIPTIQLEDSQNQGINVEDVPF